MFNQLHASCENNLIKRDYLTITISHALYAIELSYVKEIAGKQKIVKKSRSERGIQGYIKFRTQKIPVIDLRIKFCNEVKKFSSEASVIVLDVEGAIMGIVVDDVSQVITIIDNDITDIPRFDPEVQHRIIHGLGKLDDGVFMIIDCRQIKSLIVDVM